MFIFVLPQRKKINKEEDLLGCEVRSAFPQIQEIIDAKEPFDKLWRALVTFHDKQEAWLAGSILKLNAEEIEEQVFIKNKLHKTLVWMDFKLCAVTVERKIQITA